LVRSGYAALSERGMSMTDLEPLKRAAAARALEHVRPGMKLGLGTGSTAKHFVELLGEKVAAGLTVICVPTSEQTAALAARCGVPLTTLDETPQLDLTVDGADELDAALTLIKGGGAALLREKIVAAASARMIVIADHTKVVEQLGRFPLPVEVAPFGLEATRRMVLDAAITAGCRAELSLRRRNGEVVVTDGGHYILDLAAGAIPDARRLSDLLSAIPGVMEHGLFIGMASSAFIAAPDGVRAMGQSV
jgi:ribose 5-phosphate isomerase A